MSKFISGKASLRTVTFRTREEQARGLIGMKPIPDDTIYVFPGIREGAVFHSFGCLEPIDLRFIGKEGIISSHILVPPDGKAIAPPETLVALESKHGVMIPAGPFK